MMEKQKQQSRPSELSTLGEVRNFINGELSEGRALDCPACRHRVKIYPRKLDLKLTLVLTQFYFAIRSGLEGAVHYSRRSGGLFGSRFYHYRQILKLGGLESCHDYSKLAHWEFLEKHPRQPGYWTVTYDGRLFVEGKLDAQLYKFIYNGQLVDIPREQLNKKALQRVTIAQIIKGFNLEDLYIDYLKNDP